MSPITHAKIKYWSITINYLPMVFWWAVKGSWIDWKTNNYTHVHQLEKLQKQRDDLFEEITMFIAHREHETKRTFRFHRDGYELTIKVK